MYTTTTTTTKTTTTILIIKLKQTDVHVKSGTFKS